MLDRPCLASATKSPSPALVAPAWDSRSLVCCSTPVEEPITLANEVTESLASRRLVAPESSVPSRFETKAATWSLFIKSSRLEAVTSPALPMVSVKVSSICWRTVPAALSVTRGAMALAFWFS